jgi:hypothetical protein
MPSEIVRLSPHGSSLPGGAGLANLPGAAANRIGDATASLRLTGTPPEAPLRSEDKTICSTYSIWGQYRILDVRKKAEDAAERLVTFTAGYRFESPRPN